ncbi:ABC transporter substrate-binding protein [Cytobacillus massiliigabonensis]|uniref:ABC transporter substrate-binding protein n=1 Tax=Cytobacillus massiliigabonensis TaxID=1871011 RepID=UPI000C85185D|nr:ABC transporter substrate-binding protein [Cytobacillus massiliigabonensis]
MKRTWFLLVILAMLLTACSEENTTSKEKEKAEDISIMLDWYPNAVHTAIYVAKEKGYFADEGLNVNIEMPADTNDPLKLAATGKVDLAISYQTQLLVSRAEGIPVVSVAALVRHSLDAIMFKKESGIQSPKDLEGKNIGYPSASVNEAVVSTMVKKDGGDINKVKMTDVGWDLMSSLATDHVDALTGAYINHELVLLKKEGYDMDILKLTDFGVPDNYELVVVTGEKTLKKKKAAIEKFWQAVTKAQEDVKKDPDAALKVLLDHENGSFPLDKDVEIESLRVLLPLMEESNKPFGYQEEKTWNEVARWLYESKVIKEKLDVKDAFINIVSE